MTNSVLKLNGSFGEGGGQILRSSLTLSLLTGRPFHLRNVRARRPRPGLQPQHLMCVRAAAEISQAQVRGASVGSTEFRFEPGQVIPGQYLFNIGTAGATGQLLHALYLPLALRGGTAPSELTLVGGTHVRTSPCFHFLDVTWRNYLRLMGLTISLTLVHPGFYPRGGGTLVARIQPAASLQGLTLLARGPVALKGFSAIASLPEHVMKRQAARARQRLKALGYEADIVEERWPGGPGSVLGLIVDMQPVAALFFGLGERGKPAEQVADEAVDQVVSYLNAEPAAVDSHSGDQILLPLALAEGPSQYSVTAITPHLLTNAWVIRQFLERSIDCEGEEGRPGKVKII